MKRTIKRGRVKSRVTKKRRTIHEIKVVQREKTRGNRRKTEIETEIGKKNIATRIETRTVREIKTVKRGIGIEIKKRSGTEIESETRIKIKTRIEDVIRTGSAKKTKTEKKTATEKEIKTEIETEKANIVIGIEIEKRIRREAIVIKIGTETAKKTETRSEAVTRTRKENATKNVIKNAIKIEIRKNRADIIESPHRQRKKKKINVNHHVKTQKTTTTFRKTSSRGLSANRFRTTATKRGIRLKRMMESQMFGKGLRRLEVLES